MSLFSEIEKVVSSVVNFFGKLLTSHGWQTVFIASVQAVAGTVEGILEATKNDPAAAKIAAIVTVINTDLATLTGLAGSYTAAAHNTFVSTATNLVNVIQSNVGSILSLLDVKNTALVSSVTVIVNLVASGLKAILALVPATPTQTT
jgi:hypothetical protein